MTERVLDLAVVMPVYNEVDLIEKVLDDWLATLEGLGLRSVLIVLNDGSTDGTGEKLETLACAQESLQIVQKENSGHGPTILQGYKKAVKQAAWVFQVDSDDELQAKSFAALWEHHESSAAVFGMRTLRCQPMGRKLISCVSRWAVWLLFGRQVKDVNVPYRLIRADVLRELLRGVPPDSFAPNVILAGAVARHRISVVNVPVPFAPREDSKPSSLSGRALRCAAVSLWQLLKYRFTSLGARPSGETA